MTKKINEVDIKNVMENFAQKSQEDQEALREKANKLINSKNNQLSAQDKLSNLIEKVNQDFPGTLPEDAKASNDVRENLKILIEETDLDKTDKFDDEENEEQSYFTLNQNDSFSIKNPEDQKKWKDEVNFILI